RRSSRREREPMCVMDEGAASRLDPETRRILTGAPGLPGPRISEEEFREWLGKWVQDNNRTPRRPCGRSGEARNLPLLSATRRLHVLTRSARGQADQIQGRYCHHGVALLGGQQRVELARDAVEVVS